MTATSIQPKTSTDSGIDTDKVHVNLDGISKLYGDVTAVDDISLQIYKGEFFSLLGPSGCGKSTLLRMLAGFEIPSSGKILLDGEDVTSQPPYQRPVNMMFQSYALFPHMNVAQNVGFGLKQENLPTDTIEERVTEALEMVQLTGFEKRKPHKLSGGQKQRVALARSLVKRPKLLLLDEPLGALDKKLREQTQFELVNIQEELGITFIIVTHDQQEAMTVSTRIAVMNKGKIIQIASPSEIYEAPNSRYVADFIGDVNIFPVKVQAPENNSDRSNNVEQQNKKVFCPDLTATLSVGDLLKEKPGTELWLALRPEKLQISHQPPSDNTLNVLRGKIHDIAYDGKMSLYHVRISSEGNDLTNTEGDSELVLITVAQANASRLINRPFSWEDSVYVSWRPKAGVILDQ